MQTYFRFVLIENASYDIIMLINIKQPVLFKGANIPKDWGLKKLTTFAFGHFATISGHFIVNYIDIFHKSVVLMVILRV